MTANVNTDLSRRDILKFGAAGSVSLMLPSFVARAGTTIQALGEQAPPTYTTWMDVYRNRWTWDSVVRCTHLTNCWYQAHCCWDVYVKDGLVFREEQAAEYEQTRPDVPDFNPRGCQKGGCYSDRMYDDTRVRFPMKRVGPRGGRRWERVSWDQALTEIADIYLDVTTTEGPDRTVFDMGPSENIGAGHAGQARFAQLTRSISLDPNTSNGDGHHGAYVTFGSATVDRSVDDYFFSDLILMWGCNPVYTSIPNTHFFTEARYNGSKLVVISPDYSPTATKADLWVQVRPGTDGALALAICRILVTEGHMNTAFLAEQTDFPLLVRSDTKQFLSGADIKKKGDAKRTVLFDKATGKLELAPWRSLKLGKLVPELDVQTIVRLADGTEIEVRSVFSLLKDRLEPFTPEVASELCGTAPELIRQLASTMVKARNMSNVTGSSPNKYFHGNLTERAMILIFCLLGQMGRKGAGYSAFSLLTNDGWEHFVAGLRPMERAGMLTAVGGGLAKGWVAGDTVEMFFRKLISDCFDSPLKGLPIQTSATLFWNVHGELLDLAADAQKWIPTLGRPIKEHVQECLDKKWFPLQPPADRPPRILFHSWSNPLRSVRGSQRLIEKLWPKLKLDVVIDWRMSSTTQHTDYILPAAAWYEVFEHKWVTPLVPIHHVNSPATKPLGESWHDYKIYAMLAKYIQKRAKERGITKVVDPHGVEVNLDTLYDDMTMDGRFAEDDAEKVAKAIMEASSNLNHLDWEETKKKGFGKFSGVGLSPLSISNMGEMKENDTFSPFTYHVRDKEPYPTSTRRIQFYLDHDLYFEYDEALPTYKAPPSIGGDHPLVMTGGKTRWSIHGAWRDNKTLLRLQRGGPTLHISSHDAAARKINDGDWIKVWNDVGHFYTRAHITTSMRPGQTLQYHAWEKHQFLGKSDTRTVSPSPINPVELAGGHPHLRVGFLEGQPGGFDRDTRINIRRLTESEVERIRAGQEA